MPVNTPEPNPRRDTRKPSSRPEPHPQTPPALSTHATWRQQALLAGTQPRRSASAAEVVRAYLRIQARAMASLEPGVRADTYDAVHQMRVATRRLRAALRSFGSVIPRSSSEQVAAEL